MVAVYEAETPWSREDDWFVAALDGCVRVLDLGCGTGRLALGLMDRGRVVTGIDPAAASLALARARPGADRMNWIEGDATSAPSKSFEAAVMTSHVAQVFVDDETWMHALAELARAIVAGGRLAFDTRDPRARAWEWWTQERRRTVALTGGELVETWAQLSRVVERGEGVVVDFTYHHRHTDGIELVSESTLRFRSEAEVRASLEAAGFVVDHIVGGWNGEPVGAGDGELLVIARRE